MRPLCQHLVDDRTLCAEIWKRGAPLYKNKSLHTERFRNLNDIIWVLIFDGILISPLSIEQPNVCQWDYLFYAKYI